MTNAARPGKTPSAPTGYAGYDSMPRGFSERIIHEMAHYSLPPQTVKNAREFIRQLTDDEVSRLVSFVSETQDARYRAGIEHQRTRAANRDYLRSCLWGGLKHGHVMTLIRHREIILPQYRLEEVVEIIGSVLGIFPDSDEARLAAHLHAGHRYGPIDEDDSTHYRLNGQLMTLIHRHPEHAETIMELREKRQLRAITEELLAGHLTTHSGLAEGVL